MKLLLIDGNSILNRAYYGIRALSTSSGLPTNAIFGFLNILLKHIGEEQPDMMAVAFDLKDKTFRHLKYTEYKGTRSPMPEELALQMPLAKELLDALNIKHISKSGIEADDIIGILSQRVSDKDGTCTIVTGDRDALQLVTEKVTVKLAVKNEDVRFTPEKVYEKYTLYPDRLIDLKALMGDSSDNIPGVKGIGEKTAVSLLNTYGSLDGVFEHASELKGATALKIAQGKESAYLSKELGTILREGDVGAELNDLILTAPDKDKLHAFLVKTEMLSFMKKFNALFEGDEEPEVEEDIPCVEFTPEAIKDTEEIYLLYSAENPESYILLGDKIGAIPSEKITELDLSNKKVITHNAKPLMRRFFEIGKDINVVYDTMLAGYILEASQSNYSLERLCGTYLEKQLSSTKSQLLSLKALKEATSKKMEENKQAKLYYDIELPLCRVLAEMETAGFGVDKKFLQEFAAKAEKDLATLTEEIFTFAGHEFNINSPKQLSAVLFEEMGLPHGKKTQSGYSTDNDELEKLKNLHPMVAKIIEYRKLAKLKSTYADGMIDKISSDGRIHSIFTQTVTQTGRISSTEPNLQNIPIRTELGRLLRHAFVPKEGHLLVDADYSQIELRILAHIASDVTMCEAFENGTDIHTLTASQVFGLPVEMVTSQMRSRAKAVNFGIVYGIGEFSLAKDLGITRKEAKAYIDGYLRTYSGVAAYMEATVEAAKRCGYVETLFGRRRYVPEINSKNKVTEAFGKRVSMNTPIQGTAADIIKIAMVRVSDRLKKEGLKSRLILQVHDELIIEAPENEVSKVKEILKTEMESAANLSVSLVAEVGIGKDWFDAH